jgi:hypothetical protein
LATRFVRIWIDEYVVVVESWTRMAPALGKAALESCGTHERFWREIDAVGLAQRWLPLRGKGPIRSYGLSADLINVKSDRDWPQYSIEQPLRHNCRDLIALQQPQETPVWKLWQTTAF